MFPSDGTNRRRFAGARRRSASLPHNPAIHREKQLKFLCEFDDLCSVSGCLRRVRARPITLSRVSLSAAVSNYALSSELARGVESNDRLARRRVEEPDRSSSREGVARRWFRHDFRRDRERADDRAGFRPSLRGEESIELEGRSRCSAKSRGQQKVSRSAMKRHRKKGKGIRTSGKGRDAVAVGTKGVESIGDGRVNAKRR